MSEARHVTLASTSNAEDAAWLAVVDVAAVATDLGIDYRLIGGNSVALLVRVHDAATQVPDRAKLPRPVAVLLCPGVVRHRRRAGALLPCTGGFIRPPDGSRLRPQLTPRTGAQRTLGPPLGGHCCGRPLIKKHRRAMPM